MDPELLEDFQRLQLGKFAAAEPLADRFQSLPVVLDCFVGQVLA